MQTIQIDLDNARLADNAERPYVIFGSPFDVNLQLMQGGTANAPQEGDVYTLGIDDDFSVTGDQVMGFATATATTAGVVFHMDTLTTKFASVISGRPARRAYWQVNRLDGTESIVVGQDWLVARGVVTPIDGTATTMQPLVDRAEAAAASAMEAATVSVNASTVALNAAKAAQQAAASIPAFPTPSAQDNNKVITVSGGTFALTKTLNLQSIAISNSTSTSVWNAYGIKLYGGALDLYGTTGANRVTVSNGTMTVWGDSMVPATLNSATLTIGTVTNGTFSIPFSIPITQSTASSLSITGDNAYFWNLTASTATNSLDTDILPYNGLEKVWAIDIALGTAASVQYGTTFDAAGSDTLTASKVNRCVVRFDGTSSRLYCYATEDLA